jgi:hypothetical protein
MSKSDTSWSSYKSSSPDTPIKFVKKIDPATIDPADFNISYNPACVQRIGNFGSSNARFLFDHINHEPLTRENTKVISPKLLKIIEEIEKQDAKDMSKYGKKFKHFIFSSVKSGTGGAKIIATALIDILNMRLGYSAERKNEKPASEPIIQGGNESLIQGGASDVWKKIHLHTEEELLTTKYDNFFLLSSVGVYQQPLSVAMRKELLRIFNSREVEGEIEDQDEAKDEGNSYGEKARIMIMDGGFKEGIDLFDIKYIHIFEPQTTFADQKQVIGRGTRLCGQKGLVFHPRRGWNLYVNIYDSIIPEETRFSMMNARTVFDLYMSSLGIDIRLINLTVDMERVCIEGSVDYNLNSEIHSFKIDKNRGSSDSYSDRDSGSSDKSSAEPIEQTQMSKYIDDNFSQYKWKDVKMEKMCGGAPTVVKFTPTQDFIRHYFTPANPCKGILLYNSVGTGKTCSAIATATSTFEKEGYTILWVTRTTLKNDIWKNMFDQVCSISIREKIEAGVIIPDIQREKMRLLSKAWSIRPMSYKQFSNLVSAKNSMHKALVKRNGAEDPLRKTLIIIDEAHKLYGESGLSALEQPDMGRFYEGVMRSYEISGADSCRLMLMTATPITKSPMEIVKLLNLCRERHIKIEDDFETFADNYLDRNGYFTGAGRTRFLNEIAGYISYLNREKDARSFAQPIVKFVKVDMLETPLFREYDARIMRKILQMNIDEYKKEVEALKKSDTISKINSKTISIIDKVCNKYDPPLYSSCKKVLSKKKKQILQFVKERKEELKNRTRSLRDNLKHASNERKEIIDRIKVNLEKYNPKPKQSGGNGSDEEENNDDLQEIKALDNDYQKYIQSSFYNLKNKCVLQPKLKTFDSYHIIVDLRQEIRDNEALVIERQNAYKSMIKNYNKSVTIIKKEIKAAAAAADKVPLEARIAEVKAILKTEKQTMKEFLEDKREKISELNKEIKDEKRFLLKSFNQSVKRAEKERKQYEEDSKEIERQNALLSLEIDGLTAFIEDDELKDVVSKVIEELKHDLDHMEDAYEEKLEEKEAVARQKAFEKAQKAEEEKAKKAEKADAKADEKARQADAKADERARQADAKADEKARKADAKADEKARKAEAKADEKTRKRLEKEALRKTMKNRK